MVVLATLAALDTILPFPHEAFCGKCPEPIFFVGKGDYPAGKTVRYGLSRVSHQCRPSPRYRKTSQPTTGLVRCSALNLPPAVTHPNDPMRCG